MAELERILKVHHAHKPHVMIEKEGQFVSDERSSEKDIILITYGDLIRGEVSDISFVIISVRSLASALLSSTVLIIFCSIGDRVGISSILEYILCTTLSSFI
jgi:hypothetical protein